MAARWVAGRRNRPLNSTRLVQIRKAAVSRTYLEIQGVDSSLQQEACSNGQGSKPSSLKPFSSKRPTQCLMLETPATRRKREAPRKARSLKGTGRLARPASRLQPSVVSLELQASSPGFRLQALSRKPPARRLRARRLQALAVASSCRPQAPTLTIPPICEMASRRLPAFGRVTAVRFGPEAMTSIVR